MLVNDVPVLAIANKRHTVVLKKVQYLNSPSVCNRLVWVGQIRLNKSPFYYRGSMSFFG